MAVAAAGVYEFGPFRLHPAERQLLRDGTPVPLTPKAFDTLRALVERWTTRSQSRTRRSGICGCTSSTGRPQSSSSFAPSI